jgi:hypothetical protein
MEFSAENLKYMAAEVVTNYLAHKVPLSEAVASIASSSKLNPEQIKRLIEISNQVAYLKLLETASDRTFEFPLAKYEEVLTFLATPDENMKKEASLKPSPMDIAVGKIDEEFEKVAQEEGDDIFSFLKSASKNDRVSMLNKQVCRSKSELEKVACEEQVVARDLMYQAISFRKDEQFMDKIAMVLEDDEVTLTKISHLVFGKKVDHCNEELFYESDVEDAREYVALFKKAEELVSARKELEGQLERAEVVLRKEAFVAPVVNAVKTIIPTVKSMGGKAIETGKKVVDNAPKVMEKAETAFFTGDQIMSTKRDAWNSTQGKNDDRYTRKF